jgi:hypothetical protein
VDQKIIASLHLILITILKKIKMRENNAFHEFMLNIEESIEIKAPEVAIYFNRDEAPEFVLSIDFLMRNGYELHNKITKAKQFSLTTQNRIFIEISTEFFEPKK